MPRARRQSSPPAGHEMPLSPTSLARARDPREDGNVDAAVGRRAATAVPARDVEVLADELALIPPGLYDAVGGRGYRFRAFGAPKLRVEWIVLVPDDGLEHGARRVTLPRYYNLRPAPGGHLRCGRHSDYAREWVLVAGRRVARHDRLSPRVFQGVLCAVEVATVTRDDRQQPLPEGARYSKIANVLARKAGGNIG